MKLYIDEYGPNPRRAGIFVKEKGLDEVEIVPSTRPGA